MGLGSPRVRFASRPGSGSMLARLRAMLDQFEVADLPFKDVVVVKDSDSLEAAAAMLKDQASDLLVVTYPSGAIRGVAPADMITELATFAPRGPLRNLSMLSVIEVTSSTRLVDAIRMVSQSGVGALAVRKPTGEFKLVGRESLIEFKSWALLVKARERRLASMLPEAAPSAQLN